MLTIAKSLLGGMGGFAVAVAGSLALGGWLGYGYASGAAAQQQLDMARAHEAALHSAIETARLDAEIETRRAVSAAEKRGSKSAAAQGVTHEIVADTDLGCEWREPHRMRIESLYGAYGYAPDGTPTAGVQD